MVRSSRKVRDTRRRNNRGRSRSRISKGLGPGAGMSLGLIGSLVGAAALDQGSELEPQNQNVMSGGKRGRVSSSSNDVGDFILRFMEMLNTIKIYHWSTLSYPTHKATDELHEKMSELVDSFIEKYIENIEKHMENNSKSLDPEVQESMNTLNLIKKERTEILKPNGHSR